VTWLRSLENPVLNQCLANDMGLGKTLEVVVNHLNDLEEVGQVRPTLNYISEQLNICEEWFAVCRSIALE